MNLKIYMRAERGIRKGNGQSTIEYLILIAAVITAGLLFTIRGGIFQRVLNSTFETNINTMFNAAETIFE